jgi:hypothetical protein
MQRYGRYRRDEDDERWDERDEEERRRRGPWRERGYGPRGEPPYYGERRYGRPPPRPVYEEWRSTRDWRETEPYGGRRVEGWRGGWARGGEDERYGASERGGMRRGYGYGPVRGYDGGYGLEPARPRWSERGNEDRPRWREEPSWMGRLGDGIRRFFTGTEARGPHAGRGPKGYRRSDERIREDVCDRIATWGWVDASDVEVHVADGEVTLTGTVRDRRDKRLLEEMADTVPGVHDVHNQVRVRRAEGTRADEAARPGGKGTP